MGQRLFTLNKFSQGAFTVRILPILILQLSGNENGTLALTEGIAAMGGVLEFEKSGAPHQILCHRGGDASPCRSPALQESFCLKIYTCGLFGGESSFGTRKHFKELGWNLCNMGYKNHDSWWDDHDIICSTCFQLSFRVLACDWFYRKFFLFRKYGSLNSWFVIVSGNYGPCLQKLRPAKIPEVTPCLHNVFDGMVFCGFRPKSILWWMKTDMRTNDPSLDKRIRDIGPSQACQVIYTGETL